MKEQREIELDLLRVVALLAVIMVHCAGMRADFNASVLYSRILTFMTATITWQVPIYVMISGRFFLDPERSVNAEKIKKAILRLIVAFVIWDIIYQFYYIFTGSYANLNWKGIINEAIIGPYHFWYLHMCICLYAVTPFLRQIAGNKRLMEYFIVLFLVGEAVNYYGTALPGIGKAVAEVFVKSNFHFALGFTGYYILGYYLYHFGVSKKMEMVLYISGIACLIVTGILTVYRSMIEGAGGEWYVKYLMPNIVVEASAIYTFFVRRVHNVRFLKQAKSCIIKLSEYSFGVYLVHALVAEMLSYTGISVNYMIPLITLPVITLIVFIISNILVHFIRVMPYIGRKIT